VEKCEKLWRQEHRDAHENELQRGVCSRSGADATIEMRACSACAGDYEDPDRTVWTPDDTEEEERDGASRAAKEEFPAEQ
jgi:hypothetical protein